MQAPHQFQYAWQSLILTHRIFGDNLFYHHGLACHSLVRTRVAAHEGVIVLGRLEGRTRWATSSQAWT